MKGVSFGTNNISFTVSLKKRVDEYFASQKIKFTGNRKLYWKTAILLLSAAAIYTVVVFFTPAWWLAIPLCGLLGFNLAAIGFNVMHDGAHGSYSQRKWVNQLMAGTLNVMGGNVYLWQQKHNVNHHNFTNIEGLDDDIDIRPWIRTNTAQKRRWYHRYQHIYFIFLYTLTYFIWIYSKDFQKYFTGKIGETKFKKMTVRQHFIFWFGKVGYFSLFIVLPLTQVGFVNFIIGYTSLLAICGIVLAVVFQLAHVVDDTSFPEPEPKAHKMEQDWTIHQLATTANFAIKNKVLSWFVGGLNFQVEHHLFPKISHVHYPALNKIVRDVCEQFNVKYIEYPTFTKALRSHVNYLRVVGAN